MRDNDACPVLLGGRSQRVLIYALGALTGVLAGLLAVAYRVSIEGLESARLAFLGGASWTRAPAWMVLSAAAGAAVAAMLAAAPMIGGSGIPQVKAALMRRLRLDWARELPLKFAGGALGIGAGLSLGREGPSIQLGALAGAGIADLTRRSEHRRYLATAGAAAGISAAFNAPLAGLLFCLEELHRSFSPVMLTCAMIASLAANAVSWILTGGGSVFALRVSATLPLGSFHLVIILGIACGLLGSLFNACLLGAQAAASRLLPGRAPRLVAVFAAGGLVAALLPAIAGGGQAIVERAASGELAMDALAAIIVGKFLFTVASYASGAPGGIFLPMLAIGAAAGCLAGRGFSALGIVEAGYGPNFAIIGMVGFFTAVVRAPITAAVLVTEMSGSLGHFPALMLVALAASVTAGLARAEPLYDLLLERLKLPVGGEAASPEPAGKMTIIRVPVLEGSRIDDCDKAGGSLPDGCVLVFIRRGDRELVPRKAMAVLPGDILEVLVAEKEAREAKGRLAEAAAPPPGSIEKAHP